MKLPCAIVRDLLPLYAENLTEEETRKMVDEHLAGCSECRRKLGEIDTEVTGTVESAKPLRTLKGEIRKRRLYAVVLAALCVFVAVYTVFYHLNEWKPMPWTEGLVRVKGTEERPYEGQDGTTEVLVVQMDGRINGIRETRFREDDGTETVVLQGWTSKAREKETGDYNELILRPVPDRLLYDAGEQQQLLWGEPGNGGGKNLPRLALGYYLFMAVALAVVSGILWLAFRNHAKSRIIRQIFFLPLSYLAAHVLIRGTVLKSDFMERDLFSILLLTVILYALLSLAWQVFLQRRKER
ncbi:MAG: zf-HC2 domain-containing protein [Clostridia bacterium]|nr:zf-HC2 domain-containing protein [Clostridia bacterium]